MSTVSIGICGVGASNGNARYIWAYGGVVLGDSTDSYSEQACEWFRVIDALNTSADGTLEVDALFVQQGLARGMQQKRA